MTKTTTRSRKMISDAINRLALIQSERHAPPEAFFLAAKSILRQAFAEESEKPKVARVTKKKVVRFSASAKPLQTSGILAEPDDLVILPAVAPVAAKPVQQLAVLTQPDVDTDPFDKEESRAEFERALVLTDAK